MKEVAQEKDLDKILSTEYSAGFDEIRKKMMLMSYYKYGALKDNYKNFKCINALENIKKRLEKYEETGNTEFLADAANFCMIEFMYPSIEGARYIPADSDAYELAGLDKGRYGKCCQSLYITN